MLALGLLVLCALAPRLVLAGDRAGVLATLDRIPGNWPAAALKAGLVGAQQSEVILGSSLAFSYEAREAGYPALLHVNSHGEMQLFRQGSAQAQAKTKAGKSDTFEASRPLGTETLYVLFSDAPLDALFGGAAADVSLGSARADAEKFAARIASLTSRQKLAVARVQYQLVATAGGTEYTTRGIVRRIVDADDDLAPTPASARSAHSIPARIEFAFNSAELTPQGRLDLDVFGEALLSKELASRTLWLEGHTDNVGADGYNCELSLRRAESARKYLVDSFGVAPSRIELAAFGKARPIASNSTEASRHQNRRVEFVFNAPGETSRSIVTPCAKK